MTKKKFRLTVVSDRFASIPFYYFFDKTIFIGSINYTDAWNELREKGNLSINKEAFYEFLHLQRLLGDKAYDMKTKYLNSASVLAFNANEGISRLDKYWKPNFEKRHRPAKEASRMFADLTSEAISERTNDGKKYGLLLSGGLDSRLVLAGFQQPVECVTIGLSEKNNQYLVAKELAGAKGCHHSFVKRQEAHYGDILKEAVFLGGAMNMYAHAHFLNLDKELAPKADVFFHGHGFDYMFQGKYLPYRHLGIFNKKTYMKRMTKIGRDVKVRFSSEINYRLKSPDPLSLVAGRERERIKESLYSSVESILKEGRGCSNNEYDLWEYLIMHNLSRHYTFLNISSLRTIAEERTAAFDNQLFDFYLSLSREDRLNKNIFADAIKLLNKKFYKIRSADTNFNIYDSDFALTLKLSANKALKGFGFKVPVPPKQGERVWFVKADTVKKNNRIKEAAKNLANSEALAGLGFLDMDTVGLYVEKHLRAEGDYSNLILTLITIDTILRGR